MYKVYVLVSTLGKRYVGITSQELTDKLAEHNSGKTRWTKSHRPFKLAYSEEFQSKKDALKRERFLKSGDGRRVLNLKLTKIDL